MATAGSSVAFQKAWTMPRRVDDIGTGRRLQDFVTHAKRELAADDAARPPFLAGMRASGGTNCPGLDRAFEDG